MSPDLEPQASSRAEHVTADENARRTMDDLVLANQQLRVVAADLTTENAQLLDRIAALEAEAKQLHDETQQLRGLVVVLTASQDALRARIAALEGSGAAGPPPSKPEPPAFVRPNRPARPHKKKRAPRDLQFVRRRDKPTDFEEHAPDVCPDCGRTLLGGSVARTRQVIDVVPAAVKVTEHRIYSRHCGVCGKRVIAKPDFSRIAVSRAARAGIGLASWVSYLHVEQRMPVRSVQDLLKHAFGLRLSIGEINRLMQAVCARGKAAYDALLQQVRDSPFVHADETGWREDGINGYLWTASTPDARVFTYDRSRSGDVAARLLGADFANILVSDFYSAYNRLPCKKQRCWVHLLRDMHKLAEVHKDSPQGQAVSQWVHDVEAVHRAATDYQRACRQAMAAGNELPAYGIFNRRRKRHELEERLGLLTNPYVRDHPSKEAPIGPQSVLAERCDLHASELFIFVEHPNVPSDNNAAERAIRPAVVARKVSGGTRSPKGSETKAILMSLFATWRLRGLDPLHECRAMLARAPT